MIKNKIKQYKQESKNDVLHLVPLYQGDILIGYLRPITFDYPYTLPSVISLLSKWRRENPEAATGCFEVTDERTEKWLNNLVLKNENRILFLIQDINNQFIGHLGLADINYEKFTADIDAVLKGESCPSGIMSTALDRIIKWAMAELDIQQIYLDVFNDNEHAINFYTNNHFIEVERIALEKVEYEDESKWEINRKMDPMLAERVYIRMKYMGDESEL